MFCSFTATINLLCEPNSRAQHTKFLFIDYSQLHELFYCVTSLNLSVAIVLLPVV